MSAHKYQSLELKVKKSLNNDFFGAYKTRFTWNGLEYAEAREYVPWDNIKSIDWKTTAKEQKTYIKEFEEDRELHLYFVLDLTRSQFFNASSKKIENFIEIFLLIAFAWASVWDTIIVDILWEETSHIRAKKWEENIYSTLRKIENAYSKWWDQWQLSKHLEVLSKQKIRNNFLCILSDNIEPDFPALKVLAMQNEILYINNFESFENTLTHWWEFMYKTAIFFRIINFTDSKKIEKFKQIRTHKKQDLKKLLHKYSGSYIELDETKNIFIELLKFFHEK